MGRVQFFFVGASKHRLKMVSWGVESFLHYRRVPKHDMHGLWAITQVNQ